MGFSMIPFSRCVLRLGNVGCQKSVTFTMTAGYATDDVPVAPSDKIPAPRVSSSNAAQFRRGAGGRSSFSGNVVTVFGATGFLGTNVVNRLAKHGNQLIIPYRCDPYFVRELKVVGDLGQILFFPFSLKDEESIRKAVKYSNVVVNMVGTTISTKNYSINDTNVDGSRRIAKVCREMGVNHLVHVSALNADPDYKPKFYKKSTFLQSKGLGEIAVREEFHQLPSSVLPACMVNTIHSFKAWSQSFAKIPLTMPVFVSDVAQGLIKTISDPDAVGKTYEFVGPHCYKLSELVDFIKKFMDPWFWFWSRYHHIHSKIWCRKTPISLEYVELAEAASDFLTGAPTLADLGISRLVRICRRFHAMQRNFMADIDEDVGMIDDPVLPLRSPPLFAFDAQNSLDSSKAIKTNTKSFGVPFTS
uniref:NADH dehydrogenase [ubiquinone] 1 alpha subcomplex subunit 9, mitochondrial n=1 Tax=Ditylenchus dipsaci TaxID=166011 RepID=A0A915CNR3_9BILA